MTSDTSEPLAESPQPVSVKVRLSRVSWQMWIALAFVATSIGAVIYQALNGRDMSPLFGLVGVYLVFGLITAGLIWFFNETAFGRTLKTSGSATGKFIVKAALYLVVIGLGIACGVALFGSMPWWAAVIIILLLLK